MNSSHPWGVPRVLTGEYEPTPSVECAMGAPRVLMGKYEPTLSVGCAKGSYVGNMSPRRPWQPAPFPLSSSHPTLSYSSIFILSHVHSLLSSKHFIYYYYLREGRETRTQRQKDTEKQTHGRMGCTHAMMDIWRSEDNFVDLGLSATSMRVPGILA